MEKTLKELNKTWADMEFETEKHSRTGLKLLKTSEELIETLEDNQVYKQLYHSCIRAAVYYSHIGSHIKLVMLLYKIHTYKFCFVIRLNYSRLDSIFFFFRFNFRT